MNEVKERSDPAALKLLVRGLLADLLNPGHKLRAVKLRIRFRCGLPDPLIPGVPEDDWEGLTRLRYALAVMRREKGPPSPRPPTGPEMSGVHTLCWHPLARLARLAPVPPAPEPRRAPQTREVRS